MKNTYLVAKLILALLLCSLTGSAFAQHNMHSEETPLTKPGNDIFGTIQEVVKKLESNPDTDWSKVNLEALRQHLLDMKAFTEEVSVTSQTPIANGTKIKIQPKTERAEESLKRLFDMHPAMIKKEKGWDMDAKKNDSSWIITCTTDNKSEAEKIRAFGYIGLLAEGAHHQLHHWMIATGRMEYELNK